MLAHVRSSLQAIGMFLALAREFHSWGHAERR